MSIKLLLKAIFIFAIFPASFFLGTLWGKGHVWIAWVVFPTCAIIAIYNIYCLLVIGEEARRFKGEIL